MGGVCLEKSVRVSSTPNLAVLKNPGEALRRLGSIDHPQTQSSRLELLEQCLESPCVDVRDGDVVGIAFLDHPHAIPFLKQSIQQEKHAGVRADMQQVIEQLEEPFASDTKDVAK